MGTVLGAFLNRAGKECDLITRNKEHVAALNKKGAHITGTVDFTTPVRAFTPDEMTGKYDVIFLMTKQSGNVKVCEFISDYLEDNGTVCTMQNGLPEPAVAGVIGSERTLGCAVSWGAKFKGFGEAELTSESDKLTFSLGSLSGDNAYIGRVREILSAMGEVETVSNFIGARWAKLSVNSAFSSLSAITGLTFGEVAKDKAARVYALALLNESFAVADACGVKIEKIQGHDIVKIFGYRGALKKKIALSLLPRAMKGHKNIVSGMYFDLVSGKRCDIDFINGVIVHAAKNFGVPVPVNHKVIELAHSIERSELTPSKDNIALLD